MNIHDTKDAGSMDERDDLREELSAFMDGELDAERALFLQQRLAHDAALRACWERWQLQSASLRRIGQPLPEGFSDRVARALDADPRATLQKRSAALRWGGGIALAASLAVAAVFVFDATHQRPAAAATPQVAQQSLTPEIMPIEHTVLPLPDPVLKLPIPVQSGVVTAFRSPLHPVLVRDQPRRATFAPFPQPYAIDPELEAYLERQRTGAKGDVFTRNVSFPSEGNGAVRQASFPDGPPR